MARPCGPWACIKRYTGKTRGERSRRPGRFYSKKELSQEIGGFHANLQKGKSIACIRLQVYNNYASFDETELKILCSLEYGYTTARTRS